MAYNDFMLSGITKQFGLAISETTDLYPDVADATLDPAFSARLADGVRQALAVSTQKARSEFISCPCCWKPAGWSTGASAFSPAWSSAWTRRRGCRASVIIS